MIKKNIKYKSKGTLGVLEHRARARELSAGGHGYNISQNKLVEEQKEILKKAVRRVRKNVVIINPEKPEITGY